MKTDTLRWINKYIKKRSIQGNVVSPPQLYIHGLYKKKEKMRKLKANGKEESILDPLKKIENSSTEKCTIHCKKNKNN